MHQFFLPKIATAEDCKGRWACGKPGEYFRCGLCGYKFVVGDYFHVIYTNSNPECPGNPIACKVCDDGNFIEKWTQKWADWRGDKWWWFRKSL